MEMADILKLKAIYTEADALDESDEGRGLDGDEFVAAFSQVWSELSESEMRSLFSKIDADSDGFVSWDEVPLVHGHPQPGAPRGARGAASNLVQPLRCTGTPRRDGTAAPRADVDASPDGGQADVSVDESRRRALRLGGGLAPTAAHDQPRRGGGAGQGAGRGVWPTAVCHVPSLQSVILGCADTKALVVDASHGNPSFFAPVAAPSSAPPCCR